MPWFRPATGPRSGPSHSAVRSQAIESRWSADWLPAKRWYGPRHERPAQIAAGSGPGGTDLPWRAELYREGCGNTEVFSFPAGGSDGHAGPGWRAHAGRSIRGPAPGRPES